MNKFIKQIKIEGVYDSWEEYHKQERLLKENFKKNQELIKWSLDNENNKITKRV